MPLSRAQQVRHHERANQVLELVKTGMPLYKVGLALGLHPSTVGRLLSFALSETIRPGAEEYRTLVREQTTALLGACWPKAIQGDNWSIDRASRLLKDLRELDGLDAPIKAHITVTDELTAEVRALADELGVHDPDHPVLAEPHRSML